MLLQVGVEEEIRSSRSYTLMDCSAPRESRDLGHFRRSSFSLSVHKDRVDESTEGLAKALIPPDQQGPDQSLCFIRATAETPCTGICGLRSRIEPELRGE